MILLRYPHQTESIEEAGSSYLNYDHREEGLANEMIFTYSRAKKLDYQYFADRDFT